ncbi:MAG: translation initiation factor eIF-2B [Deltaproteobacteria bacterium]|nr:translation initiation factor eIF-2B [Deltaproteobacteria bacterium]MBW2307673.1 translation initiation factor eIF-2B [Deltaproteobacteria bacterium]
MRIPSRPLQELAAIRDDRVQGAGELARRAVGALGLLARHSHAHTVREFLDELDHLGSMLAWARPSMAVIQRAVVSLVRAVHMKCTEEGNVLSLRDLTARLTDEHQQRHRMASAEAAAAAAHTLSGFGCILTHSRSRTVIDALIRWSAPGRRVVITESRPMNEGFHTARELAQANLAVTLITDAQAGLFVPQVEAVLVGADSVLRCGSIINKAGTLLLALAAHRFGVPVYVACETLKFRISSTEGEPGLEEKDPGEVAAQEGIGFTVRNIYFDITPPDLLTGIVTEAGVQSPEGAAQRIREEENDYLPWIKRLADLRDRRVSD